jgi:hypothetical protein
MGEMRNACSILVGKAEEKRSLGRPTRRCEGNNRAEMVLEDVDWVNLTQDRNQWRDAVKTYTKLQSYLLFLVCLSVCLSR